jgi:hypothetical protein
VKRQITWGIFLICSLWTMQAAPIRAMSVEEMEQRVKQRACPPALTMISVVVCGEKRCPPEWPWKQYDECYKACRKEANTVDAFNALVLSCRESSRGYTERRTSATSNTSVPPSGGGASAGDAHGKPSQDQLLRDYEICVKAYPRNGCLRDYRERGGKGDLGY